MLDNMRKGRSREMILIIGGSFQGKEEFAKKLIGQQKGGEENWEQLVCRGDEPWQKALEKPCLVNFHGFIRQLQETEEAEKETEEFLCQVLKSEPLLITMDEVGCGIVPLKKEERDYREAVGRAGQKLAAAAREVWRVQCGIPIRIKE